MISCSTITILSSVSTITSTIWKRFSQPGSPVVQFCIPPLVTVVPVAVAVAVAVDVAVAVAVVVSVAVAVWVAVAV